MDRWSLYIQIDVDSKRERERERERERDMKGITVEKHTERETRQVCTGTERDRRIIVLGKINIERKIWFQKE